MVVMPMRGQCSRLLSLASLALAFCSLACAIVDLAATLIAQDHEKAAREFLTEAVQSRSDDMGPIGLPTRTAWLLNRSARSQPFVSLNGGLHPLPCHKRGKDAPVPRRVSLKSVCPNL